MIKRKDEVSFANYLMGAHNVRLYYLGYRILRFELVDEIHEEQQDEYVIVILRDGKYEKRVVMDVNGDSIEVVLFNAARREKLVERQDRNDGADVADTGDEGLGEPPVERLEVNNPREAGA